MYLLIKVSKGNLPKINMSSVINKISTWIKVADARFLLLMFLFWILLKFRSFTVYRKYFPLFFMNTFQIDLSNIWGIEEHFANSWYWKAIWDGKKLISTIPKLCRWFGFKSYSWGLKMKLIRFLTSMYLNLKN